MFGTIRVEKSGGRLPIKATTRITDTIYLHNASLMVGGTWLSGFKVEMRCVKAQLPLLLWEVDADIKYRDAGSSGGLSCWGGRFVDGCRRRWRVVIGRVIEWRRSTDSLEVEVSTYSGC